MKESRIKEDISITYLSAMCAYAGIDLECCRHDDDSTDCIIKKELNLDDGQPFLSVLRIQLKCTSSVSQYSDSGEEIIYTLKAKNFNDMCMPSSVKIILGLLVLPLEKQDWIKWSNSEIEIFGCMYWKEFSHEKPCANKTSKRIHINKNNILNSETLNSLLLDSAKGEFNYEK